MYIFVLDLIMQEKNISEKELETKTGISQSYINKIKNNNVNNVELDTINEFAIALNVNLKELFYSSQEYFEVQKQLDLLLETESINSPQALKLSQILDRLLVLKMSKND